MNTLDQLTMNKAKIFIVSLLVMTSCSIFDGKDSTQVSIRLSNATDFDFQNVIIDTSTGEVNFENISSGQKTGYKTVEIAYRYAFVELEIDGKVYTLQPTDYVGETPLKKGNYTYEIDADDSQEQYRKLSLTLVKE